MRGEHAETLYRKVGRRYVPVATTELHYPYENGAYLVIVSDGVTSTYHNVQPDYAAIEAAAQIAGDELTRQIAKAAEARHSTRRQGRATTAREKKAFEAWRKIAGPDATLWLEIPAARDIADKVVDFLKRKVSCENSQQRKGVNA